MRFFNALARGKLARQPHTTPSARHHSALTQENPLTGKSNKFNALRMDSAQLTRQEGEALKAIFGPGCWYRRAARILDLHPGHVRNIALGYEKLTRRKRVILETYTKQRIGARSSHRRRAHEQLDREWDKLDQAMATGFLILKARKVIDSSIKTH